MLEARGFRRSNRRKSLCHNARMSYESQDDRLDDAVDSEAGEAEADEAFHDDDDGDGGFDAAVVICPECGHANLEFRTRCRRCRGTLASPSNLTLGGHLLDRMGGSTGGESAHGELSGAEVNSRTLSVLLFVMFLFVFPIIIQAFNLTPAASVAVLFLFLGGLWKIQSAVERRKRRQGDPETGQRAMPGEEGDPQPDTPPEPARRCPSCDAGVMYIDDICPECGEIVAPDLEPE